jgi:hypothetical protein
MTTKRGTFCQICAKARATTTAYRDGPNGRRTYHTCEKCAQGAIVKKVVQA